jgi:hypothetical protein
VHRFIALAVALTFVALYVLSVLYRFAEGMGQAVAGWLAVAATVWWVLVRSPDRVRALLLIAGIVSSAAALLVWVLVLFVVPFVVTDLSLSGGRGDIDVRAIDVLLTALFVLIAAACFLAYARLARRSSRTGTDTADLESL